MAYELESLDFSRIEKRGSNVLQYAKSVGSVKAGSRWRFFAKASPNLRRKMYSLAPVSRLPQELLLRIFSLLAHGHGTDVYARNWVWIQVTHVCSEWRMVALGCPLLWTYLDDFQDSDTNATMLKLYLERSREAPLEISYKQATDSPETLNLALHCIHRIRDLDISLSGSTEYNCLAVCNNIRDAFLLPAPNLISLSFKMSKDFSHAHFLPSFLLNQDIPLLKHFHIERVRLSGNLKFLKDLTSLHLSDLHAADMPSLDVVLFILRQCPRMEDLELDQIGSLGTFLNEGNQQDPVELLHLRNFRLASINVQGCSRFLHCLQMRADAEYNVSCYSTSLSDFWIPIRCHYQQEMGCENFTVIIDNQSISIEVLTKAENGCIFNTRTSWSLLSASITDKADVEVILHWLCSVIEDCFWRDSKLLHMQLKNTEVSISREVWKVILFCLPKLEGLKCEFVHENSHDVGFAEEELMIVLNSAKIDSSGSIIHYCPNLVVLELIGAHLHLSTSKAYIDLIRFLSFRHNLFKQRIKLVKLIGTRGLSYELVNDIRKYADTVVWNNGNTVRRLKARAEQPEQVQTLLFGIKFKKRTFHLWKTRVITILFLGVGIYGLVTLSLRSKSTGENAAGSNADADTDTDADANSDSYWGWKR